MKRPAVAEQPSVNGTEAKAVRFQRNVTNETLLLAVHRLCLMTGDVSFTDEQITIEAHRIYPERFGFKMDPKIPDRKRTVDALCAKKGSVLQAGWLLRRDGKYQMTPEGADMVKSIRSWLDID